MNKLDGHARTLAGRCFNGVVGFRIFAQRFENKRS